MYYIKCVHEDVVSLVVKYCITNHAIPLLKHFIAKSRLED